MFLNAAWTTPGKDDGDEGVQEELEALLSYLSGEYDGDDEFVRALDEEVHSIIARPDWRKNVMFWSEYYEQLAQEAEEVGMQKGMQEGRVQQTVLISQLADVLQEVGRSSDLLPALHDQKKLNQLCQEFELIE